jgi:prepilin-type processing-associated H-X9-DG protein
MYRVLGADGKEYGPVPAEAVRQWIAEGRVNPRSQLKPEGAAEWQTVGSIPEFAALFAPAPGGGLAEPLTGQTGPAKTSRLAVASLVLGILGLLTCGITSLVGLVLGIIGLVKVNRSNGQLSGKGLAIAGICTSALFLLMVPLYAAMLLPALAKAKARAQSISCMNNVKQLSLGVMMYASSGGDKFPKADQWCDAIRTQAGSGKIFQCPADLQGGRSSYAFNKNLSELPTKNVPNSARTVMIFESEGGWNQSGGRETAVKRPRHEGKIIVAFADGHVELVQPSQLSGFVWSP